jgi:hypothetical protein
MLFLIASSAYAWTEYKETSYADLDGDLQPEIIVKSNHGAGIGHYIEMMRIFKETEPLRELSLIFMTRTLDSYTTLPNKEPDFDIINEVKFTEQNVKNGAKDIIVRSQKVCYKDENKAIDKKEDFGVKIYKWDGKTYKATE